MTSAELKRILGSVEIPFLETVPVATGAIFVINVE
jgi:hypothetical protein